MIDNSESTMRALILTSCLLAAAAAPAHSHQQRQQRKRPVSYGETRGCLLSGDLAEEIASYESVVRDILDYAMDGPFMHRTYNELAEFVDTFGARPSGTEVLERSIDYMINITREEGIDDIVAEEVEVPKWTRGKESLSMVEPRFKQMALLGLGTSVSTPDGGISAEVIVVHSFDELKNLPDAQVRNKIVVYNVKYDSYGKTAPYRTKGASEASKKGAAASLVRSITPFSINTPHTGAQEYEDGVKPIPTAAITVEDAELIDRITARGKRVIVRLEMSSKLENATSRNTLIDLKGRQNPEKLVIVSGHIDSWDVGEGAMDDGGGLFISWAVPVILKKLGLHPRRTIRSILWTAEEPGLVGAKAYEEKHRNESHNINFIMESDEGTFKPSGLAVAGTQQARCMVAEVLKLFSSLNATTLQEDNSPGSDISVIVKSGVPGAGLLNENERYFWFHHTEGDTMTVEDPHELDMGTAFWTAVSYVIADISVDIPR